MFSLKNRAKTGLWVLACLYLSACHSLGDGAYLSATEMQAFTALPAEQRVMGAVRLRWEVRQDVGAYCASSVGMSPQRAASAPPLACAIWSARLQECTIVTGPHTSHLALGHEVRHCYEGQFHP